ncbi:hypothetical protein ACFSQT_37660 [Mesorhizobium calcicola]|uniref:Uncharacterized protein n=1 Tax=Mesorhizobium calcicola TaxID=1300310 RepID=A0ABW4WSF2_9HYPH
MDGMTSGALARLAFWARGMVAISDGRMEWPGFSYADAEWARMRTLSEPIGAGTYQLFTIVNAVIFIILAALGIFGVFLPLATVLFPVPAETSALKFSLLLAAAPSSSSGLACRSRCAFRLCWWPARRCVRRWFPHPATGQPGRSSPH